MPPLPVPASQQPIPPDATQVPPAHSLGHGSGNASFQISSSTATVLYCLLRDYSVAETTRMCYLPVSVGHEPRRRSAVFSTKRPLKHQPALDSRMLVPKLTRGGSASRCSCGCRQNLCPCRLLSRRPQFSSGSWLKASLDSFTRGPFHTAVHTATCPVKPSKRKSDGQVAITL